MFCLFYFLAHENRQQQLQLQQHQQFFLLFFFVLNLIQKDIDSKWQLKLIAKVLGTLLVRATFITLY